MAAARIGSSGRSTPIRLSFRGSLSPSMAARNRRDLPHCCTSRMTGYWPVSCGHGRTRSRFALGARFRDPSGRSERSTGYANLICNRVIRRGRLWCRSTFGDGQNVAVRLGLLSGDLVDVDLDCPEALALADIHVPETRAAFLCARKLCGADRDPRWVARAGSQYDRRPLGSIGDDAGPNGKPFRDRLLSGATRRHRLRPRGGGWRGTATHATRRPGSMPSTPSPTARTRPTPFDAKNLGIGNLGPAHSLSHANVHEVDAREGDLNQCFAWTRHRVGALDILQHLAVARAVHYNSSHRSNGRRPRAVFCDLPMASRVVMHCGWRS